MDFEMALQSFDTSFEVMVRHSLSPHLNSYAFGYRKRVKDREGRLFVKKALTGGTVEPSLD